MEINFKIGDDIICHKACIMKYSGSVATTVGKKYKIIEAKNSYKGDNRIIIDDHNEEHYFSNKWEKYFRGLRKEKLIRLKEVSNGQEKV